jgi:glucose-6-phosphate 1-epimerase
MLSIDQLELRTAQLYLRPAKMLFACGDQEGAGELPILECTSPKFRALISLQGAQLLSFCPVGAKDLLWLSPLETFRSGRPIRGGIPLCLPWFGVNRREPNLPKHGLVRAKSWTLADVEETEGGDLQLSFVYSNSHDDLSHYPWQFSAKLQMRLGDSVDLQLSIINEHHSVMPLSFAMHSYFAVNSLLDAGLAGVVGAEYLDNCLQLQSFTQDQELLFDREIDRVYEGLGGQQLLHGAAGKMAIEGSGCDTVVVWNPGVELASTMADIGPHYSEYVCVERGMAFADELKLGAGKTCVAEMKLSIV